MKSTRNFILALCASLPGCMTIGPDFVEPDAKVAKQWLEQNRAELKSGDVMQWWTSFNDPVLNQLIDLAYKQNLDLQIAAVRILEARAQLGIAKGSLYPQKQEIGAALSYDKHSENEPNFLPSYDATFGSFQLGFDALWEVDVWGRFQRGVEAASARLGATEADYDDMQVSLTAEVAATYIQIRTFQQRLALAKQNAQIQERSFHIAEVRYKNGFSTELDMQQAKALLHATRALIAGLEVGLRQSTHALSLLLSLTPSDMAGFLGENSSIPSAPSEIVAGIPADMLRRRPDIRREELKAAAQSALIGVAKADLLPRFSLRGSIGLASSKTGTLDFFNLFDMESLVGTFGPSVSWPILNYGRLTQNVRVQDARFQQLIIGYKNTVLRAAREVEDAMIGFIKAREQVADLDLGVKASHRAVELSLAQYRDGLEDYTRVLNSQQFLVQQQDKLTESQGEVARKLIAAYKALGGGWQTAAHPLAGSVDQTMKSCTDGGASCID